MTTLASHRHSPAQGHWSSAPEPWLAASAAPVGDVPQALPQAGPPSNPALLRQACDRRAELAVLAVGLTHAVGWFGFGSVGWGPRGARWQARQCHQRAPRGQAEAGQTAGHEAPTTSSVRSTIPSVQYTEHMFVVKQLFESIWD